ncbi:MAG: deoxyguanosinetriphosphate triphosphohydrolase [Thermodesulfobacteriota bacterium]|nr:deoxyguanosinetriphosphate triphosphohydrolase [Thermodesulfobacteriota bacterium]
MSIRSDFEEREKTFISPYGCLSSNIRNRDHEEPEGSIRTAFQLDRERIVYSNAFRRLKHKTQVFLSPLADQYRTRLTHTLEVAQISRTLARAMRLNEDLAEAVALGHDIGHTPFGHSGETVLRKISPAGFAHNEQSLRVVEKLENNGKGLNLTFEVRDGILKHSKGYGNILDDDPNEMAITVEGRIVRVADIMAYLNHDLDDALRCRVIERSRIPEKCVKVLGKNHSERATTMIRDVVYSSRPEDGQLRLRISEPVFEAMTELRHFLYDHVYRSPKVHAEFEKANRILTELYEFFYTHTDMLEAELKKMEMGNCMDTDDTDRVVCDFIASITDEYALALYSKLFFPTPIIYPGPMHV